MKIVFDTNVLIAAFISRNGACHKIFEYCALTHQIILSDFILHEFRTKMEKKFKFSLQDINEALSLIEQRTETVSPKIFRKQICRDKDDDLVLGTAIVGNCDCILTGDKDLLILKEFESIKILKPNEFLDFEKNLKTQN